MNTTPAPSEQTPSGQNPSGQNPSGQAPGDPVGPARRLGLPGLVAVYFFTVAGGPFGTEPIIAAAGAGMAILLVIVVPLVWALPVALMSAELATALPQEGGPYAWVARGVGMRAAAVVGWTGWVASWVALAAFPVLFAGLLAAAVPALDSPLTRYLVALAVIWTLVGVNLRGAVAMGAVAVAGAAAALAPVIALWISAGLQVSRNPFTPWTTDGGVGAALALGLFTTMWNYMGWDTVPIIAGEVHRPQRNYPRAIAAALVLTVLVYAGTFLLVLAAVPPGAVDWSVGAWVPVAQLLGGPVLAVAVLVAGLVASSCLFGASLLSTSRLPFVLARDRLLPAGLGVTDHRGVPRRALLVSGVLFSVLVVLPFDELAVAAVTLTGVVLGLEFTALLRLRRTEPDLARPFRIRLPHRLLPLLAAGPAAMLGLALAQTVIQAGVLATLALPALLLAPALVLTRRARHHPRPTHLGSAS